MAAGISERLLARVDSLPTLPAIATRILELTLNEGVSSTELGKLLSQDPALTAKILKVVNSASFGLRFPVSSTGYAITVLGLQRIRTLILSLSIFETLSRVDEGGPLDKTVFWRHSVASASGAKALAVASGRSNPEEAYVAGLIHDIGMLLLDTLASDLYVRILEEGKQKGGDSFLELERLHLGTTHLEIGAELARQWNLPHALCAAIRYHQEPEATDDPYDSPAQRLAVVSAAADYLAWCAGYPSLQSVLPPTPGLAVLDLLSSLELEKVYETIHQDVRQGSEIFLYQDPSGERWQRALLRANSELGRIATQLDLANRGLITLNTALLNTQHRLGEHDPLQTLLAEVVGTLGYDRAFLLVPEETGAVRVLKAMSRSGAAGSMEGKTAAIPQGPAVASRGRLLREGSAGPAEALIRALDSKEAILVPICEGHSLKYYLAADFGESQQPVPPGAEETLACLAAQAGLLLENYRLYQTVQDMAVMDSLTGVCNRRRLMEVLSEEADRATRIRQPFSVAILDLDFFKTLNEGEMVQFEVADGPKGQHAINVSRV